MRRKFGRPLDGDDSAIGIAGECRRVIAEQLAVPPESLISLFFERRKPILPENGTHLFRGLLRKRVCGEQREHVGAAFEEVLFGARHDGIRTPGAEGSEPQIPVEARLVRRIEARSLGRSSRLLSEGVWK